MELTHFDERGQARMVDVGHKDVTVREARARGTVRMKRETLDLILGRGVKKGDVFSVARIAGITAAKKTWDLIPLAHPLPLTAVEISFSPSIETSAVEIEATVRTASRTGVEMEALTAVAVAGLTVYDMCKAVDRAMTVTDIRLMEKSGGKSGHFLREGEKRDISAERA
jgi:cyclic pyranopterin phosphate synthase